MNRGTINASSPRGFVSPAVLLPIGGEGDKETHAGATGTLGQVDATTGFAFEGVGRVPAFLADTEALGAARAGARDGARVGVAVVVPVVVWVADRRSVSLAGSATVVFDVAGGGAGLGSEFAGFTQRVSAVGGDSLTAVLTPTLQNVCAPCERATVVFAGDEGGTESDASLAVSPAVSARFSPATGTSGVSPTIGPVPGGVHGSNAPLAGVDRGAWPVGAVVPVPSDVVLRVVTVVIVLWGGR